MRWKKDYYYVFSLVLLVEISCFSFYPTVRFCMLGIRFGMLVVDKIPLQTADYAKIE